MKLSVPRAQFSSPLFLLVDGEIAKIVFYHWSRFVPGVIWRLLYTTEAFCMIRKTCYYLHDCVRTNLRLSAYSLNHECILKSRWNNTK